MKEEMLHALQCLYISVPEDVAKDVNTKVMNYVAELEKEIEDDNAELDVAWAKVNLVLSEEIELEKKLSVAYNFADLCIEEMFHNNTYENRLHLQEQLHNLRVK